MQYLLLIYGVEAHLAKMAPSEMQGIVQEFGAFSESIKKSGHLVGSNRLQETSKATTVRVRDNKKLITDGPFAETKEQLGGYYLVEAKDLDEAIAMAARIPSARWGSIEVRPIFPMNMPN